MEFFDYDDEYRANKRRDWDGGEVPSGPTQYFHRLVWQAQVEAAKCHIRRNPAAAKYYESLCDQMLAESYWTEHDRPYVKVFPKMAHLLGGIRLNVPMRLLKLPYMAFSIRFSKDEANLLRESPDKPPVQALLIVQSFEYRIPPQAMGDLAVLSNRGLNTALIAKHMPLVRPRPTNPPHYIGMHYQYGEPGARISDGFFRLGYDPEGKIDEALTRVAKGSPVSVSPEIAAGEYFPSTAFMKRLWSITLATCLMIEGDDDNILPDIPKRLIPKYEAAQSLPQPQRDKLTEEIKGKAKKIDMFGLTLGRKHELELPRPVYDQRERPEGEGSRHWELQFGHYRSPHARGQWFGSKENPQFRVVLIDLTRVRRDLPLDPRPRNYRLTDRAMEE